MVKLYFKKLLHTILFIIGFFGLLFIEVFVLYLIIGERVQTDICRIAVIILAFGILIRLVYSIRRDNYMARYLFIEEYNTNTFSFITDFKKTLTSIDNLMHALAVITVVFLVNAPIAISVGTPFLGFVIVMPILLVATGLLFSMINALVWYIIHTRWMGEKENG